MCLRRTELGQPSSQHLKRKKNEHKDARNKLLAFQGKFIFCPTSLVTKHIFEYMETPTSNFFISGGYGIGQTVSIILYLHLNNFITKYFCEVSRHKASGTQGQNQENKVNKAEEMQELQGKGLLRYAVYKYFYWSIERTHSRKGWQFIKSLVLQQAVQLSEDQRQKLAKETGQLQFSLLLRSLYPPNVQVRSIVDQISKLASLIRQYNFRQQHLARKDAEEASQLETKMHEVDRVQIMLLNLFLRQMVQLGEKFGVNSSAIIQRQLLKKNSNEKSGLLSLDLQDRQLLAYYRIPYEKALFSSEGANEFKQLVWFEIERRLSFFQNSKATIDSIKKRFYEEAEKMPVSGFDKFLTVRQLFDETPLFKLINKEQEVDFIKKMISTLEKVESKGLEIEKILFKRIFDKNKLQQKLIIENLHQIAEKQMQNADKSHQLFSFRSKDIQVDPKLKGYNLSEKLSQRYRNTTQFQENLPYELLEDEVIRLPWTVQQFLILSSETLYPEITKEYQKRLSQQERQVLRNQGGAKAIYFYDYLIQCLIKGSRTSMLLFTQKDANGKLLPSFETIKVQHVTTFAHFNKSEPKISFVDHNFKKLLEISEKHPNEDCVAIPHYTDSKGNYVFSDKSKAVYFIICKYDTNKVFHITTYDATVSKYVDSKQTAHFAFYKEEIFSDMRKFNIPASQYNFRHVIMCPSIACKPMEVKTIDGYSYLLQYADILDLVFRECPDAIAKGAFDEVQRIAKIHLNYLAE